MRPFLALSLLLLLPFIAAGSGRCDYSARALVRYARGFQIEYHPGYKIITTAASAYERKLDRVTSVNVLVPRHCPAPPLTGSLAGARIVHTPVRRLATTNDGDVAMLRMLGLTDVVVGIAGRPPYPEIAARARRGLVRPIGYSAFVNLEQVLDAAPELLAVVSQSRGQQVRIDEAAGLGIAVLPNHAWLEATPLGFAEWIKALAVFFDQEAAAERVFNTIVGEYKAAAMRANTLPRRITAVFATPTPSGNWTVDRNGKGARLIEDAGALNLMRDNGPVHYVRIAEERMFQAAREAEFWISDDHGEAWDLVLNRPPFARVAAGRVYDPFRPLAETGRQDYYASGLARPDLLLKDLQSIFYPALQPDHRPVYFRKRPARD